MKYLVVFAICVGSSVMGQKPFYASASGTGIQLASRFQNTENADANQAAPGLNLGNRIDIPEGVPTTSTTTIRLPIDALGDAALIKQISKWPKDKQPFWYLNSQIIEEHRQQPRPVQPAVQSRSSFSG